MTTVLKVNRWFIYHKDRGCPRVRKQYPNVKCLECPLPECLEETKSKFVKVD